MVRKKKPYKTGFCLTTGARVINRNPIKSFIYEVKPFFFIALAAYFANVQHVAFIGKILMVVLVGASCSIIYMRARNRGLLR